MSLSCYQPRDLTRDNNNRNNIGPSPIQSLIIKRNTPIVPLKNYSLQQLMAPQAPIEKTTPPGNINNLPTPPLTNTQFSSNIEEILW